MSESISLANTSFLHDSNALASTLPPLSTSTKNQLNGYYLPDFRNSKVFYRVNDLPPDLNDLDAPGWKDAPRLKKLLKMNNIGKKKSTYYSFPLCLIRTAVTLEDRMTMINYWLNLSKEKQQSHRKRFAMHFLHPTISASPVALRSSAAGAALAAKQREPFKLITTLDNVDLQLGFVQQSESGRQLEKLKQIRTKVSDETKSEDQFGDRIFDRHLKSLVKRTNAFLKTTQKTESTQLASSAEVALVIKLNMKDYKLEKG